MSLFAQSLRGLFGGAFKAHDFLVIYGARLDETGTDGLSPITVVAGAIAIEPQWSNLEAAWDQLLSSRNVSAYHWKEFNDRKADFQGWSDYKCRRFQDRQEKIITKYTTFRVSAGIDDAVHADVKRRMKGVKGFRPDSNYSLCLRMLMFGICEQLVKVDPDCRLRVLVEDGPWAAGAATTYQQIAAMTGKWRPAKHAHRLAGFASAPKGEYRSLEAADYLARSEYTRLIAERRASRRENTLSYFLRANELEQWYEGMIKEKEARRAFGKRKPRPASSSSDASGERSS